MASDSEEACNERAVSVYNAHPMRIQLAFASAVVGCVLAACGGDDGGSSGVDAPPPVDAAPDAPAELTGLGKKCVLSAQGQDCPPDYGCLGPLTQGGTTGFCTQQCLPEGSMFTTDAQGAPGQESPTLASGDAVCSPLYTGSPGVGKCLQVFGFSPTPPASGFMANTTYTFDVACVIEATNGACPAGTTIQAQTNFCYPN